MSSKQNSCTTRSNNSVPLTVWSRWKQMVSHLFLVNHCFSGLRLPEENPLRLDTFSPLCDDLINHILPIPSAWKLDKVSPMKGTWRRIYLRKSHHIFTNPVMHSTPPVWYLKFSVKEKLRVPHSKVFKANISLDLLAK